MHPIRIIALVLALCATSTAFAQEDFLPGYVVRNNGDTLRGLVDYRNWKANPRLVDFKTNATSSNQRFSPLDLKGFRVSDEYYESAIVKTEISPGSISKLDYTAGLQFQTDTVFLQSMIIGPKSLYFFENRAGNEQFYIKKEADFELLLYKMYLKIQDGKDVVARNNNYLGQLSLYLDNCPNIQPKISKLEYRKKSMEDLFHAYYDCTKSNIQFQKKTENVQLEPGVLLGASLTSLQFRSDEFDYLVNAGYNPSLNVTGGMFLNIVLPRNLKKWSVFTELLAVSYSVNGKYFAYTNENSYSTIYTKFAQKKIKANALARFNYSKNKTVIFYNAGISFSLLSTLENTRHSEITFYNSYREVTDRAINGTRAGGMEFIFGGGIKFKKLSFEVRYERGAGISALRNLGSPINRGYFLAGYWF